MRSKKWTFTMVALVLVATVVLGLLGLLGAQLGRYDILPWKDTAKVGLDLRGGITALYSAAETGKDDFNAQMDETVEVLQNRLKTRGFVEATVKRQGSDKVRVEIPNISNPDTLFRAIGQPGRLEFRDPEGKAITGGQDIIRSGYQYLNEAGYAVVFQLNDQGTQAFKEATSRLVGKQISIYLDEELISSPSVNEVVETGEGFINGDFTEAEAQSLALIIQSGALPVDLTQTEVRTVSGSLGANALSSFVWAAVIAAVVVLIYLVVVYRLAGLLAVLSMGVYGVIMMYCISLMSSVFLSLAAVGGIILGIGLALDAHVMVLERLKEELRLERPAHLAVAAAFKKASPTIIHLNIVMLIGALIIAIYASASVKVFAYTLAASSFATLFVVLLVTRLLLKALVMAGCKSPSLLGLWNKNLIKSDKLAPSKRFKWMALMPAVVLVAALIVGAVGGLNPGLDFVGGTLYTVDLKASVDPDALLSIVRKTLPSAKDEVRVLISGQTQAIIEIEKGALDEGGTAIQAIENNIKAQYPEMTALSQDTIPSNVDSDLISASLITAGFLILTMLIYIGARVGFLAGVSAAAAMLHDAVVTLALAVIFGLQINAFVVAAIFIVMGYSAMNAFALFDRIRENLRRFGGSISRSELADRSVRESLSRLVGIALMAILALVIISLTAADTISDFVLPVIAGLVCATFSNAMLTGPFWTWCHSAHEGAATKRKMKKSKRPTPKKKKKA